MDETIPAHDDLNVEQAIADFRAGRFVIIIDDEERENEGDLAIAAQHCTPAAIAFMASQGRGLICVPMASQRVDQLGLPLMVDPAANGTRHGTAFTVSVEARQGISTGISAADRATTVRVLAEPTSTRADLTLPGHIFPLRARPGGVLERPGQTEASVDLARLAGLQPVAVICEIMREDGQMARLPDLQRFAAEHNLRLLHIADLIAYRRRHERLVTREVESRVPTDHGDFRLIAYSNRLNSNLDLALVAGDLSGPEPVLIRLHSECLTGDIFGSLRCDCGPQLAAALDVVATAGRGAVIYLRQEGRGIGLLNKLRAYGLQDDGLDTVEANLHLGFPADPRDYTIGAQILADLGIARVRLLSNNPRKWVSLERFGFEVVERVPLIIPSNPSNRRYLTTKRDKLGHLLESLSGDDRATPGAHPTRR